jgi:A/G-specific adenine glycosylase
VHTHANTVVEFVETVWGYYSAHGRHDLPWRIPEANGTFDPYKILVSECMLQQTQVSRAIPKYGAFLRRFPTVSSLAESELGEVLRAWQGLGYNRRAKYLWQAAQCIEQAGSFPSSPEALTKLPGVGVNTAGAILAYAWNQPAVFIETNIRTVYIHHFTGDADVVSDDFIRDCLERTLDRERPREFYWALMDYGSYLKTRVQNLHRSKQYTKQSKFEGSKRQIRGQVLRELSNAPLAARHLVHRIDDERLSGVLDELVREGLIKKKGEQYSL